MNAAFHRHESRRRAPCLLAVLLLLCAGAKPAERKAPAIDPEQAQSEARAAVQETVDQVIGVLKDDDLDRATRRERIEAIVYERFDFGTMSRLVLGRNWRKLSPEQRQQFVQEFKRHLSLSYGETLDQYHDQKVVITGTRMEARGDVTVRSEIQGAAAEPVEVIYRLRRRPDGWRVIDVIVESASLIQNFRAQIEQIIHDVGPEGLIDKLREKNAQRVSRL